MPVVPSLGCWPPKSAKPRASDEWLQDQQTVSAAAGGAHPPRHRLWTRDPASERLLFCLMVRLRMSA
jgi:hypothetical protein